MMLGCMRLVLYAVTCGGRNVTMVFFTHLDLIFNEINAVFIALPKNNFSRQGSCPGVKSSKSEPALN